MEYRYKTKGTCSTEIVIDLDGDVVQAVRFQGGCNGNLQGIGSLVQGMKADEVIRRCKGIQCGFRQTSCPDQLAQALYQAMEQQAQK